MAIIEFTKKGIYCPEGGFYIDPVSPVSHAVITHGHSDHARKGHKKYLCAKKSLQILKHRLGSIQISGVEYAKNITHNGIKISFHPAGHIFGSAQVRIESKGEIAVISGDYKLQNDGISTPFEPISCHHFVTECTFGLPIFRWQPQSEIKKEILKWYNTNLSNGITSILSAYSLGKAQRLINLLSDEIENMYIHYTIADLNEVIRKSGGKLPQLPVINPDNPEELEGALLIMPSMAAEANWVKKLKNKDTAFASGWMQVRGIRRRRNYGRGFVISDHVDWPDLNKAVYATGASKIYPVHGYTDVVSQWFRENNLECPDIQRTPLTREE